jgi:hypothetical protein
MQKLCKAAFVAQYTGKLGFGSTARPDEIGTKNVCLPFLYAKINTGASHHAVKGCAPRASENAEESIL